MECKKQENSVSHGKLSNNELLSLQCVFKVVIFIFSLVFAFIVIWQVITSSSEKVQPIELTIMTPSDSLDFEVTMEHNKLQLQTLSQEIASQNKAINDRYNLLVRAKEMEGNFIRLVSAIAAFVLALLGFLGYRTIKDIETKAESIAEQAAKDYTKDKLEQVVRTKWQEMVSKGDVLRTVIADVEANLKSTTIADLENRLSDLEDLNAEDRTSVSPLDSSTYGPANLDQLIDKKD